MSDPRYQAGIKQGVGAGDRRAWPTELPGLGPMQGGQPLARCVVCPPERHPYMSMTNVQYGGQPLCKGHAFEKAEEER